MTTVVRYKTPNVVQGRSHFTLSFALEHDLAYVVFSDYLSFYQLGRQLI